MDKGNAVDKRSDQVREEYLNHESQEEPTNSKQGASEFMANVQKVLVGDDELSKDTVRLLSLVFMLAALGLGFLSYGHPNLPWVSHSVSYRPTLVTTLYSFALVLPLYVRGVLKWYGFTVFSILSLVLNVMVTAVVISMLMGGKSTIEYKVFGGVGFDLWTQNSSNIILMTSILLSWLGMRVVAGLAWVFVFVFTIVNISVANSVLGIWGALFLLFGFLGIVLQNNLTPALVYAELKSEFSGRGSGIKKDINESARFTGKLANSAAKRVI